MPDKRENMLDQIQYFPHQEETLIKMYLQSWIKVQKQRSGCCRKNLEDRGTPNAEYISKAKP